MDVSALFGASFELPMRGQESNTNDASRNHKQLHIQSRPEHRVQRDEDDMVTPRAMHGTEAAEASRPASCSSFNSLYDVSDDDDSALVPLKLSNSVKLALRKPSKHPRLPSLVIPSPSAWPTIEKLKAGTAGTLVPGAALSPLKTPLSPQALARLASQNSRPVPAANATPSLDGSLTSDDHTSEVSCPTPASHHVDDESENQWEMPIQLDVLATDFVRAPQPQAASIAPAPAMEMQERQRSLNQVLFAAESSIEAVPASALEPLSAMSLLTPRAFFSILNSPSKHVWGPQSNGQEAASGASEPANASSQRSSNVHPTARQNSCDSDRTSVDEFVLPEHLRFEYDEEYEAKLHREATTNMSRTSLWLNAQDTYLSALLAPNPLPPSEPSVKTPPSVVSPRKNVRFEESTDAGAEPEPTKQEEPKKKANSLFYHAFQHLLATNSVESAFTHRNIRASALSTQRRYMADKHICQLSSEYCVPSPTSLAAARDFSHLPDAPESEKSEAQRAAVQEAERERHALAQVSLSVWSLLANRYLAAGTSSLLPPAAAQILASNPTAHVLDFAGAPTADWAWALALEHRTAQIQTLVVESPFTQHADWKCHRGPRNHRVVTTSCAWSLPFADNFFHVVSARTLHTLLRDTHDFDEWEATLTEIRRVLVPGGVLCYETMDAEVRPLNQANASAPPSTVGDRQEMGPALAARSAEFAVALRHLGYSTSAGQVMPQRLRQAGFTAAEMSAGRRAWVSLALARGCELADGKAEAGVEAVTSLAASLAWERWMLGLQREMGRPRERLLDGVGRALDEAGACGAWRVLRGWVRKE